MTRIAPSAWLAEVRHSILRVVLTSMHPPSPQPH
jgi:hypothetical protein